VPQLVNFMQLKLPAVFNKFFGFNTNFKAVTALDDQGQPVAGSNAANAPGTTPQNSATSFGSCSTPQIKFATGFDGRKETAFEPVDQRSKPIPVP
jgi:hypothetical protein